MMEYVRRQTVRQGGTDWARRMSADRQVGEKGCQIPTQDKVTGGIRQYYEPVVLRARDLRVGKYLFSL